MSEIDSHAYGRPLPRITPLNAPFWSYTRAHDLRFKRCLDCGHWIYPIAPLCQACWSDRHEWAKSAGNGIVSSWVTYHRAFEESFRPFLPYVVIQVDLDEGFRMISNFIDPATRPSYRMRVSAVFDDVTPDITLVKFKPA